MTPERWEEIQALFIEVVELEPAQQAQRLASISETDPDLGVEVESLLAAHQEAGDALGALEDLSRLRNDAVGAERGPTSGPSDPYGLVGRTISHYRVLELLGGGGMGVLYKAADTRLDRTVALKFLPPQWSLDASFKERFEHEARAAAALDHNHVCNIYEIGETEEGQLFISMAYYEGETLKEKLARGPLSVEDAVGLAAQAASGLAAAHARGIVHRDIKPGNLMVTGDEVLKILDFGLAKTAETALTESGMRLGTPAYMSPEQTRGHEITQSTDLWSLGVVLYEMLTGRRPFRAHNDRAVISAIRHEEPERPGQLRNDLPAELEQAVLKLLGKDPEERYDRAEALLADLVPLAPHIPPIGGTVDRQAAAASGASTLWARIRHRKVYRSVLVGSLALAGLGAVTAATLAIRATGIGRPSTLVALGVFDEREPLLLAEFEGPDTVLARTVTEALRIDLSGSEAVALVSQRRLEDALRRMERERPDRIGVELAREIAIRDGVKGVIGGSINPAGSGYVLTAQVVSPEEGNALVSRRETAADEDEIIPAIDRLSKGLRERIGESLKTLRQARPLPEVTTGSLEALRKYVEGRRAWMDERAIGLLEEAIALDSGFAMAWRGLGIVLINRGEERTRQVHALTQAFERRDRLPQRERYIVEATYYRLVTAEYAKAIEANENYLAVYPNDRDWFDRAARQQLAVGYMKLRGYERAEEILRQVTRDHPGPPCWTGHWVLVQVQVVLGKFDDANSVAEDCEWASASVDSFPLARTNAAGLAMAQGNYQTAQRHWEALLVGRGEDPYWRAGVSAYLAFISAVRGRLAEAERLTRVQMDYYAGRGLHAEYLGGALDIANRDVFARLDATRAVQAIQVVLEEAPLRELDPLDRPYVELAALYAQAGRTDLARAMLSEFDSVVEPRLRGPERAAYARARGELALAEGRYEDAIAEFRASDIGTCLTCAFPGLIRSYDAAGEPDSVIAILERYLVANHVGRLNFVDHAYLGPALEHLGALYDERGEWEKASEYYAKFAELWKEADPELQPRVEAVRRRLNEIVAQRG